MKTIYLTVSPSGGGKSTLAEKLAADNHATIVSSDAIREELTGDATNQTLNSYIFGTLIPQRIREGLAHGDVIFDATNTTRRSRKSICDIAKSSGARVVAYVLNVSIEECKRRNSLRSRVVPEFVIDKQFREYQLPDTSAERIDEIIYVD